MNTRLYIETYGCQMNVADSDMVAAIAQSEGFVIVDTPDAADTIIINTCSVRDNAEQKIWHRLDYMRGLKRRCPAIKIGIIGCMAQRLGMELLQHEAVDFVAGPDAYRHIVELIRNSCGSNKQCNTVLDSSETYSGISVYGQATAGISGFVPITRGCNNFCTYCIVPYTRGRERSNNCNDILNEVKTMSQLGFKEVYLLGQNVNSYDFVGSNGHVFFPDLMRMVAQAVPQMRIRFTTSHPKDLSDELIEVIATHDNICKHIHLPVQSGSNVVLQRMNRKYTREWYLDRIAAIRRVLPDCGLSTDVFCGFSGETDDDFRQTVSLLETVRFDAAYMFKYSDRSGTFAHKHYPDDIAESEKISRLNTMIDVQNRISLDNNRRDIGREFEVLVEGRSKRSADEFCGRTQQNKVVVFPNHGQKKGDFVKVKILSASSATLHGSVID